MSDSEPKSKKKKLSKEAGENYWLEYFNDNNWIPVHPINDDMFSMEQVEEYKPFKYALAIDNGLYRNIELIFLFQILTCSTLLAGIRNAIWILRFANLV
jgi:hypothetical protein